MNDGMTKREIDALVHEKVFGLKVTHKTTSGDIYGEPDGNRVPEYSGNIADAWRVVDKMAIRKYVWGAISNGRRTDWSFLDNGKVVGNSVNEATPYAICLSALKTVGLDLEAIV